MSKDDYPVIAYKILAYFYACLKEGVEGNPENARELAGWFWSSGGLTGSQTLARRPLTACGFWSSGGLTGSQTERF